MRVLGIDYGKSKIGLAIGDLEIRMASPFGIFPNNDLFIRSLKSVIDKEKIGIVVVGVPYGVGNTVSAQAKYVLDFVEELKKDIFIPINIVNEHLTTSAAKTLLSSKKEAEDDVAAMLILQSYLDAQ